MTKKQDQSNRTKRLNSDVGSAFVRKHREAAPPPVEDKPLTLEEHRARVREEMEQSRETIRLLRAKHSAHLAEIGEKRASVN